MARRGVHILIPGTCEYVTLHGKGGFADGIEFRILTWGDCLEFCQWVDVITGVPYNEKGETGESEKM